MFEARGEILTVPVKKGDPRNLTSTPGVAERDPAWSPDGQKIAYFSDASGEYELHICNQIGGDVKKYRLGKTPSFYYDPVWSPDGTRIAYTDKRLNLWFLDLASGKSTLVDTSTYAPRPAPPVWSPDSKWLAYARKLKNHLNAIFLYSLASGKSHQITDGRSDARNPAFDKGGQYLYFTASTDAGRGMGGIELSNFDYPASYSVYLVVLGKDAPSPLAPESDEEKNEPKKDPRQGPKDLQKKAVEVKIDLEDIDQRIVALPIPARNYAALAAGKPGVLFLYEAAGLFSAMRGESRSTLHKFELDKRRVEKFAENITAAVLSFDGEKLLLRSGGAGGGRRGGDSEATPASWAVVSTAAPPKPGEGILRVDNLEVKVESRPASFSWPSMDGRSPPRTTFIACSRARPASRLSSRSAPTPTARMPAR